MRNEMIGYLAECWERSGVGPGETVLVHSRISNTLRRLQERFGQRLSAEDIVESFRQAVGPNGTLLFPLFNFDFTKGVPFDIRSTPSQMGATSEAARLYPDAVRTGHPIYSFSVFGKNKALFEGVDNFSGYGADSVFAILHKNGGRIAVLDLPDQNSMTFYHYVEEFLSVDYRFHKRFTGQYTNRDGITDERTYGLFVRDIDRQVLTDVNRMGERLWAEGIYMGDRPGQGCGLRSLSAAELYESVAAVIRDGKAMDYLYSIGQMK